MGGGGRRQGEESPILAQPRLSLSKVENFAQRSHSRVCMCVSSELCAVLCQALEWSLGVWPEAVAISRGPKARVAGQWP